VCYSAQVRASYKPLVLLCALFAPPACAFIDLPYLTPEQPAAGEIVSVNVRGGVCDGIGTIPGYPQITQDGNAIRIVLWSVSFTDPVLCNIPIGTSTYAVGAFATGSYTLQVDRDYQGDLGEILRATLSTIPLVVTGAIPDAAPVPASSPFGLLALLFILFGVARTYLHPPDRLA